MGSYCEERRTDIEAITLAMGTTSTLTAAQPIVSETSMICADRAVEL